MTRVAVVEDHVLLGESLCLALRARGLQARRLPVEELGSMDAARAGLGLGEEAVEQLPDVVLLDLDLAGLGRGDDLVEPLTLSGVRVVVVTGDGSPERWVSCLDRGALAVLPKSTPLDRLVEAVAAAEDGAVMAPSELERLRQQAREAAREREARLAPFAALSPRETQVLRALAQGRHVAEIASEAVVSEATVRAQVRSVLAKLGVGSQLAAVAMAHAAGLFADVA